MSSKLCNVANIKVAKNSVPKKEFIEKYSDRKLEDLYEMKCYMGSTTGFGLVYNWLSSVAVRFRVSGSIKKP